MNFVQEAMGDADAILFVTDLFETEFANTQVVSVYRHRPLATSNAHSNDAS